MPEFIQNHDDEDVFEDCDEDVLYSKNINHCQESLSLDETKCLIQFKNWILCQPQILNPVLGKSNIFQ